MEGALETRSRSVSILLFLTSYNPSSFWQFVAMDSSFGFGLVEPRAENINGWRFVVNYVKNKGQPSESNFEVFGVKLTFFPSGKSTSYKHDPKGVY